MAWKPRLPVKTVETALEALLPLVPDVHIEPRELVTDEDVLAMMAEMEAQDPSIVRRGRLAVIRHRARLLMAARLSSR